MAPSSETVTLVMREGKEREVFAMGNTLISTVFVPLVMAMMLVFMWGLNATASSDSDVNEHESQSHSWIHY
jgi:uncharacterized membrane protein